MNRLPILNRVRKAWNAFLFDNASRPDYSPTIGVSSGESPHRSRSRYYNDKSIVSSIYTRISIDVAAIAIRHIQLDEQHRYAEDLDSGLNNCLTLQPNIDQGPRAFRQDICMTMFDKGVAALVPVDTDVDPETNAAVDILTLRVGEIKQWYPKHVRLDVYNENRGIREEITLEKRFVAIVENPLYAVMNHPNSTLQRLIRKLNLLDVVDEQSSSGKLDLIIQLPYVVKSPSRKTQAENRRSEIEMQLKGSQYGIAYTDGTEKITQLNRPAENNLLKQIEYLTNMLYGQLGITEEVMNGTADEKTMLNYYNRTIEPILDAIIEAQQRTFIGVPGTKRGERIKYFRDPFKLVPVSALADIADKFSRNEILSGNEIRGFMGLPPSKDPKADKLQNSNMPQPPVVAPGPNISDMDSVMNQVFDGLNASLDKMGKPNG